MTQLSLFSICSALAGVAPAICAVMSAKLGDGEGRKKAVDRFNARARAEGLRLTGGRDEDGDDADKAERAMSKSTFDKVLNPAAHGRPPSVNFILVYMALTEDYTPLRLMAQACGLDVMTAEDRLHCERSKAEEEVQAARRRLKMLKGQL